MASINCLQQAMREMATLFQGAFEEFIQMNDEGFAPGVRILHILGGSALELEDNRAVTQTKMTISQRPALDGVVCDAMRHCCSRSPKSTGIWPTADQDRLHGQARHAGYRRAGTGGALRFRRALGLCFGNARSGRNASDFVQVRAFLEAAAILVRDLLGLPNRAVPWVCQIGNA